MYPLLLFCGGVHGSAVVLGGTNPTVAQNMTTQIRVAALLFFRNSDAELLFSKSKSLDAKMLISFRRSPSGRCPKPRLPIKVSTFVAW